MRETMVCIKKTAMRHKRGEWNRSDRNFKVTQTVQLYLPSSQKSMGQQYRVLNQDTKRTGPAVVRTAAEPGRWLALL